MPGREQSAQKAGDRPEHCRERKDPRVEAHFIHARKIDRRVRKNGLKHDVREHQTGDGPRRCENQTWQGKTQNEKGIEKVSNTWES